VLGKEGGRGRRYGARTIGRRCLEGWCYLLCGRRSTTRHIRSSVARKVRAIAFCCVAASRLWHPMARASTSRARSSMRLTRPGHRVRLDCRRTRRFGSGERSDVTAGGVDMPEHGFSRRCAPRLLAATGPHTKGLLLGRGTLYESLRWSQARDPSRHGPQQDIGAGVSSTRGTDGSVPCRRVFLWGLSRPARYFPGEGRSSPIMRRYGAGYNALPERTQVFDANLPVWRIGGAGGRRVGLTTSRRVPTWACEDGRSCSAVARLSLATSRPERELLLPVLGSDTRLGPNDDLLCEVLEPCDLGFKGSDVGVHKRARGEQKTKRQTGGSGFEFLLARLCEVLGHG
jgi:hypothetical protein